MLICGYLYRDDLTASFHAGLGNGLHMYGKDSAQTAAVDDIQSTVSHSLGHKYFPMRQIRRIPPKSKAF